MMMKIIDINKAFSQKIHIVLIAICIILSGCQLTENRPNESQYSHYYLWLKSLSSEELLIEVGKQKQNVLSGYYDAEVNLALLYALPNSPIYNPYSAKTKLNKLSPELQEAVLVSSSDFGFITMLKDQLNRQILTLNKLIIIEQNSQENQSILKGKKIEHEALMRKYQKLKQQINQLKEIEFDINNQEQ